VSIEQLKAALPASFDSGIYRALHPDLQRLTDEKLQRHYSEHGINEGRRAHSLPDRAAFAALANSVEALELGPFQAPLLSGPGIRYFDILDRSGLLERAQRTGKRPERIPEHIHFVSPIGDLSVVDRTFDAVLSSHVLEHQPDLVRHLKNVERLLRPGAMYLVLVPDKRYCFDHFLAPSTIADVLEAHYTGRTVHSLRSQIEHEALTTFNDSVKHWAGQHGAPPDVAAQVLKAVARYRDEPDLYVDVHAWYFTPTTFEQIMGLLRELKLTTLTVSRIYPTLKNSTEFWAVLEAPAH
jgi:SAM-dependent methyltransferase